MNKSIRSKLFLSIGLLLVFFICLLWILNNLYLGQYYTQKKKNTLIESAKLIDSIYKGDIEKIRLELDITANKSGGNIEIKGRNNQPVYSSGRKFRDANDIEPNSSEIERQEIAKILAKKNQHKTNNLNNIEKYHEGVYTFETQSDPQLKIEFMALITKLNNGDNLAIRVPIISIKENVDIANKFTFFTGIIILALGAIWAFLFSKKFTKPIRELNSVALEISKFNFDKKCEVKGNDELGQLSQSINHLSTELDTAMTELNVKNNKLEEDIDKERKIDEMRKEFISNVSHELRTPISIIQGYAEGLVGNVAETQEDKDFYCNVIMNEADKMNRLVKDLLDESQIESGFFKFEKTEFELPTLIEYIISKYKTAFAEKEIHIDFILDEKIKDNPFVFDDIIRVEQIFTNIINNAINHVDENKSIKITLSTLSDLTEAFKANELWKATGFTEAYEINKKIRVHIYNTGKHIPADSLEKIWTSFYKVDKARTRAYGGYGLGLSIVKAIQDHNGNLYGVDNVDNGVSFWFDIDLADQH